MRLTQATTSWEDGLEGLSRLMTPELMYDLRSRFRGEHPLGMGVKCPVRTRTAAAKSVSQSPSLCFSNNCHSRFS